MSRPTIPGLKRSSAQGSSTFYMECCINAISEKLCIYSAFQGLSKRNVFPIILFYYWRFWLEMKIYWPRYMQNLTHVKPGAEQRRAANTQTMKHRYQPLLICAHTCVTEPNFWKYFLFSSASKNYVKNKKERWVWRTRCDCYMIRWKQCSV